MDADQRQYQDTRTAHIRIAAITPLDESTGDGELVPRKDNEPPIVESYERLFGELLDSVYDAVLITDAGGQIIRTNARAYEFFQYADVEILSHNILDLISNADNELLEIMWENLHDNRHVFIEAHCICKDRSVFPADITVNNIHMTEAGQLCFFIRNITSRVETETKLKDAQKELVRTAHSAGMAMIATGVLHNVGNLLNSINVSCDQLSSVARHAVFNQLEHFNERLQPHRATFREFVANTPDAARLAEAFIQIGEKLLQERDLIAKETESLNMRVDMIKEVVVTQQECAKVGYFRENIELRSIVDDALAIQNPVIERDALQLKLNFGEMPPIAVQKAKILHVLVNLITNSIDAMAGNVKENRILTFTTTTHDDFACVAVTDNGVGIDDADIKRIFNHGFSTKANGHGFGLHTSANFMTEMGGRLTVTSAGIGQGATFTLWIPDNDRQNREAERAVE